MEQTDGAVQGGGLADFLPRDRENIADQHVLQMFALRRGLAHGEDRRRRCHGVADPDDRLLRNPRVFHSEGREDQCAEEGEYEADPVDDRRVRVAMRDRHEDRDGRAERGDLCEREVDENDPSLDDVYAEVCMNPRENQTGDERRREERKHRRVEHYFAPLFLIASINRLMS